MTARALATGRDSGASRLDDEIRQARVAHAEKLEATCNVHDAAVLRLQVLKDELAPLFARNSAARRVVDLALVPGDPPRLWIDMICYVVMAPDPSTYRLQRDSFSRHDVLLQSARRDEVIAAAMQHVASHLVEREKQLQLVSAVQVFWSGGNRSAVQTVVLAWLSGVTVGVSGMAGLLHWLAR